MISVSARKSIGMPVLDFISKAYHYPLEDIDSVFGFTEFNALYGGRPYHDEELTQDDIESLYDNSIGYRIPLTNHFADYQEFRESRAFLTKYHRKGNTIIATNDDLALWIKNEYPLYKVEASAIKKLDKLAKIDKALKLYDSAVLPASCNDDTDLLNSIECKDRVRLFIRAGCAYNCKSRVCYRSFSNHMRDNRTDLLCSMNTKPRELLGRVDFSMDNFRDLGYTKFKAVP